MKGRARVLDSTPLYDAVATQDTVTQLRAAIRKLLMVLDNLAPVLAARVRAALERDDDYATAGKPPCDWDDPAAREELVDALVHDALAALAVLDGETLSGAARDAADLLAIVAGQDVAEGDDGVFRIVRGVARDRVISTVDPQARHGHKSQNRRFDGYKTHASVDPDSELIDEVTVTPANTPDRDAVDDLLEPSAEAQDKPEVVGDSAYADGETRDRLTKRGYKVRAKVPPARNRAGRFTKDRFTIDLEAGTVTCPAEVTVHDHPVTARRGQGQLRRPLRAAARCARAAPQRGGDGRSPSTATKPSSRPPGPSRPPPNGSTPTEPTARSSNARSPTSPAGSGVDARPDVGAWSASPPTSTPEPPPSTSRASPPSASASTAPPGRSVRGDHRRARSSRVANEPPPRRPTFIHTPEQPNHEPRPPPTAEHAASTPMDRYFSALLESSGDRRSRRS